MAAILGSIAAIAAIRLEFGFLGSNPKAVSVTGSIFNVLGSIPSAANIAGSNFLGSKSIEDGSLSLEFDEEDFTLGLDLSLSPFEVDGVDEGEEDRASGESMPIA